MILRDYRCAACGSLWESLEPAATVELPCECGHTARAQISGTHTHMPLIQSVSRGGRQPTPPGAIDTRSLAEGQSYREWRAGRKKQRREARRREVGLQPKPFVGGGS